MAGFAPFMLVAHCERCGQALTARPHRTASSPTLAVLRRELKESGLVWDGAACCEDCRLAHGTCDWRGEHNHPSISCYRRHRCRCDDCRRINADMATRDRGRGTRR